MSHCKTARQYRMKDISIKLLWIRVAQFESVVQLSDDGLWQCFIASATLSLRGGICEKECLFSYESTGVLTEKFTYTSYSIMKHNCTQREPNSKCWGFKECEDLKWIRSLVTQTLNCVNYAVRGLANTKCLQ